jgi:predicted outer membrane repeat protein
MFAAKNTAAPSGEAVYIESVFSTYLYTGTGSSQTITNSIDLSTKGGLVWIKGRSGATGHRLTDTVRGATKSLESNSTAAEATESTGLTAFGTTGFTIGADADYNTNAATYASWTFREQAKFFDVVTYTGNGANNRQISHNLGSAPGCIILKRTDGAGDWWTYHRSLGDVGGFSYDLQLNTTSNRTAYQIFGTASTQTSTYFTLGTVFANEMNGNGATYVAYLFAHDAGGFGSSGTDNVISCGSYTGTGASGNTITLGYEPQWILIKNASAAANWLLYDTMRGLPIGTGDKYLVPNATTIETDSNAVDLSATGFSITATSANWNTNGSTYIYIAIRRGPMKTPTSGTSVFSPNASSAQTGTITSGFPTDLTMSFDRTAGFTSGFHRMFQDRLRGAFNILQSNATDAETNNTSTASFASNTGIVLNGGAVYASGYVHEQFRRAPGFFDVVCYSGNSVNGRTVTHNLGVTPQLIIVKPRTIVVDWSVYAEPAGNTLQAPLNAAERFTSVINCWNNTSPTASVFSLSNNAQVNRTGDTYVAYLFATCAGVSKVGSYTGTGALQTVDCGFSAGARFVLIHRIDVNADWYVWDSARGITSGNDPYLLLNSTAAEVTNTNYVDTDSTGFKVTAAAPAGLNASGGNYLFLAIA